MFKIESIRILSIYDEDFDQNYYLPLVQKVMNDAIVFPNGKIMDDLRWFTFEGFNGLIRQDSMNNYIVKNRSHYLSKTYFKDNRHHYFSELEMAEMFEKALSESKSIQESGPIKVIAALNGHPTEEVITTSKEFFKFYDKLSDKVAEYDFVDDEFPEKYKEEVASPYYLIEVDGFYTKCFYKNHHFTTYDKSEAKQFLSEASAYKFIDKYMDFYTNGFEVIKVPGYTEDVTTYIRKTTKRINGIHYYTSKGLLNELSANLEKP